MYASNLFFLTCQICRVFICVVFIKTLLVTIISNNYQIDYKKAKNKQLKHEMIMFNAK